MKKREEEQALELLRDKGMTIRQLQEMLESKSTRPTLVKQIRRTRRFKLGVVSDTHLLDKGCAISELHDFYQKCAKNGVKQVVHAGDMFTGLGSVYKGQINDLIAFGVDDHVKYAVENYPHIAGISTYFIGGN